MNIKHFFTTALLAGALALPVTSLATERSWVQPQNGPFDGVGHQWNVVPGVNDIARFNGYVTDSAFTVTLTQNVSNQYIRVGGANPFEVTLNLAGHTYTASLDGSVVGDEAGNTNNTLKLTGGGTFNAQDFNIGRLANSSGKLVLAGSTHFRTLGATEVRVGNYGSGVLEITDGAQYTSEQNVRVGRRATGEGTVLVTGKNSQWNAAKEIFIGSSDAGAKGTLTIEAGGKVTTTGVGTNGAIAFAQVAGTKATGLITGTGSELSSGGTLAIGGSRSGAGGQAEITVADRGVLKVGSTLLIYSGGTLKLDGGTATARDIGSDTNAIAGTIALNLQTSSTSTSFLSASRDLFLDASTAKLTLTLADGVSFAEGDVIHLIDYKGTLTGTFSNYSEGQLVSLGDTQFSFSYAMGVDGNRFVGLAAIPEPGSVGLLLMGGVLAGAGVIRLKARRKS